MKNLIFLLLLISPISFPQIQPLVKDFLISGSDDDSATFLQYLPNLFTTNSNNFLTTWFDYREGEPVVYAQRFDANGNFIGNNIRTGSNAGAYLNEDSYILALSTRSQPFFEDTYIFVKATLLNNSNQIIFEEEIYSTLIPWCGTGYIDGEVIVKASDNGFYFITNEGGYVALVKIESTGNYQPINIQFDDIHFVTRITSSATSNGNYFFAWINGLQEDTLETGLYATFINTQDSIIVSRLPIAVLNDSVGIWGEYIGNYNLQSIALNDSTYKLFWMNNETFMLYSIYLNTDGEIISEIDSMLIPVTSGYEPKVTITNLNDDSFYLFISHIDENYSYSHTFLKYNSEGEFVNYVTEETESYFATGLFNTGQDKFFKTSSDLKDVFLDKLEYFTTLESKKINDDESGSNQINNRLTKFDDNSVFSVWQDENNYFGTWIDKDGNLSTEKVMLDNPTVKFFPDKESVAYWIKENENSDVTAGYTIYDQNFNEKLSKTLFTSTSPYNLNIHLHIISDSTFIVLLDSEHDLVLLKESKSGITLNERTLATEQNISERFFPVELNLPVNSFWVYWNKKLQHFSDDLTPLTETIELPVTFDYYLGDDRFLNLEYKSDYLYINRFIYGTIINTALDTIKTNIRLTPGLSGDNTFLINRIDNNDFLSVYDNTEKYYARAFSNNGTVLTDSFLVSTGSNSYTSRLSFIVNDGKVFFSWSDARNEGKGYDIYGNIFDLSSITSVKQISSKIPEKFSLYQNYPNPFNPSTRIAFSIKENSLVQIKIYDILGNEVSTLVNEEKSPGRYEVEFNGAGLASGFYFYRINAGAFTQTRKMVLLK